MANRLERLLIVEAHPPGRLAQRGALPRRTGYCRDDEPDFVSNSWSRFSSRSMRRSSSWTRRVWSCTEDAQLDLVAGFVSGHGPQKLLRVRHVLSPCSAGVRGSV